MKYGFWAAIVAAAFAGCAPEDNEANIPQMDNSIAVPADGPGGGSPLGMDPNNRPAGYPAPISRPDASAPAEPAADGPTPEEPTADEPAPAEPVPAEPAPAEPVPAEPPSDETSPG